MRRPAHLGPDLLRERPEADHLAVAVLDAVGADVLLRAVPDAAAELGDVEGRHRLRHRLVPHDVPRDPQHVHVQRRLGRDHRRAAQLVLFPIRLPRTRPRLPLSRVASDLHAVVRGSMLDAIDGSLRIFWMPAGRESLS